MKITLGSNIASIGAQRRLKDQSNTLSNVFEQLSSGLRINKASDDPAGLSVALGLQSSSRIYSQGVRNLNDAISLMNIADGAIRTLQDLATRQRELANQAANGSLSTAQRTALDAENQSLAQEYQRVIETTKFNGQRVLDPNLGRISFQAGPDALQLSVLNGPGNYAIGTGAYGSQTIDFSTDPITKDLQLLARDINNDGYDDIIAAGLSGDDDDDVRLYIKVFLGNASGTYSLGSNTSSVVSNDWDSGKESLEIGFEPGTNNLQVYANVTDDIPGSRRGTYTITAAGTIGAFTAGSVSPNSGSTSVTLDMNGDGVDDNVTIASSDQIIFRNQLTTIASVEPLTQAATSLTTAANSLSALTTFTELGEKISRAQAATGASLSRLQTATSFAQAMAEQYTTAADRIFSVDIAEKTAELVRTKILQQASAAVLAQANQQPALALQLLKIQGGSD